MQYKNIEEGKMIEQSYVEIISEGICYTIAAIMFYFMFRNEDKND